MHAQQSYFCVPSDSISEKKAAAAVFLTLYTLKNGGF